MRSFISLVIFCFVLTVLSAFAAMPFLQTVDLPGAGVSYTWTNETPYYAFAIHRIEAFSWDESSDTVTVYRIRGARTNTVGTLLITSDNGTITNGFGQYYFQGDVFVFDPTSTNGGGEIELQLLQSN